MTAGLLEIGEIMVSAAQRRLETVSQNVANLSTPGFKKADAFEAALNAGAAGLSLNTDFAAGALRATGQPFDLALSSEGFFLVQGENRQYYTRAGHFLRQTDGRVVDAQGFALQTADGGDLVVGAGAIEILEDGVVLEDGAPVARIGLFALAPEARLERLSGAYFEANASNMRAVSQPLMRQGMIEGSNVELSGEMLQMMQAMRQAETGARILQTYDQLIGQTISTFGRLRG